MAEQNRVEQQFSELLLEQGIKLTDRQLEQFSLYYRELIDWNSRMNLTGITELEQVYLKHFYDSLSISFFIDFSTIKTLADIGSGAGFPSIPLKIVFPACKITIVDSLNKRITFLKHVAATLGLDGVSCVHGRAEDIARMPEHRDQYDMATARAVAKISSLNELCLPFVKPGGQFIAMKGSDPADELKDGQYSMQALKASLLDIYSFKLPIEDSERHIIAMKKNGATPSLYPRKAGIPLKQPLVKTNK